MSAVGRRLLAVGLPLSLVVGGAWLVVAAPELSSSAARMEAQLDAERPEVVIVGSDLAWRAIDDVALAEKLGVKGKISTLWIPASNSAGAYALVKRRVLDRGVKPRLIVFAGAAADLFSAEVHSGVGLSGLDAQVSLDEPAIRTKASAAQGWSLWERAGIRVAASREALGRGWAARFGGGAAVEAEDPRLHRDEGPVVEREVYGAAMVGWDASLVPELAALCAEAGVPLALLRLPVASGTQEVVPDTAGWRTIIDGVNQAKVGWVDLADAPLAAKHFADGWHLNAAGRAAFTPTVAAALLDVGALSGGPMLDAALKMPAPTARREGAASALVAGEPQALEGPCQWRIPVALPPAMSDPNLRMIGLGAVSPVRVAIDGVPLRPHAIKGHREEGCSSSFVHEAAGITLFAPKEGPPGEVTLSWSDALPEASPVGGPVGWWALPGTRLVWRYELTDPSEGPIEVEIDAVALGEGSASLSIGDQLVTLSRDGRRLSGALSATADPRVFEVALVAESAPVLVRGLVVTRDGAVSRIGSRGVFAPSKLSLLRLEGKALVVRGVKAPPDVETPPLEKQADGSTFPLAARPLSDPGVHGLVGENCSPYVVQEDGVALARHVAVRKLASEPGSSYHTGTGIVFTPSVGQATANGKQYTVALAEERRCAGLTWVYPNDLVRLHTTQVQPLLAPARFLEVTAHALGADAKAPRTGTMTVVVAIEGGPLLRVPVPMARFRGTPLVFPLMEGVDSGARWVDVKFESASDDFLLVTDVALTQVASGEVGRGGVVKGGPTAPPKPPKAKPMPKGPPTNRTFDLTKWGTKQTGFEVWWRAADKGFGTLGPLSDGSQGLTLVSPDDGDHRLCTSVFAATAVVAAEARLRVAELKTGDKPHMGVRVEIRWRDADGEVVKDEDGVALTDGFSAGKAGAFRDLRVAAVRPEGAARADVCVRFAKAVGRVELSRLAVSQARGAPK